MDDDELNASKSQAIFEFTKRKRWADTLISELVNVAVLVFSQTGTIIHCDAAINTVTGYSEEQITGRNFSELLHPGDTLEFFKAFEDCIATQKELTFYVRIKPSDHRDTTSRVLELKANPYQAPGTTENLCVFAMLSPYPTPSVGDLDSFLALKLENEQLARRIEDLKNGHFSDESFGEDSDDNVETGEGRPDTIVDKSERALAQAQAVLGAAAATNNQPNTSSGVANPSGAPGEMGADGLPPKKKRRVTDAQQGRVCTACGRNNSPEWRKGPQGPKTLCNACGLRWAKKSKGTLKDGDID
ncbi:hypothetical protein CPB86DRAFT_747542 [Serendipita vermifera]|nr:hypothetical protein CPB86DRAFT_747542 [Serendipita vermifera]